MPPRDQSAPRYWGEFPIRPQIVCHRGAAGLWTENSLSAFRSAITAGYGAFEIDVVATRDRDLVVMHDLTVDRTCNGRGTVRHMSTAALARLRLTGTPDETIPHLSEVLSLFQQHGALSIIEIKFPADDPEHDELCRGLVEAIDSAGMTTTVTISAFDWRSLATIRRLTSVLSLTAVTSASDIQKLGGIKSTCAAAISLGARDLALEWTGVDKNTARVTRAHDLRLGAWTPNGSDEIARLVEHGVDWIITDRPDLAPPTLTREPKTS